MPGVHQNEHQHQHATTTIQTTTAHLRKKYSNALPVWCVGRRQATQTNRNHNATEANADGEDDPEAKSFKPSRGGGGGGGGGGSSSHPPSPKHSTTMDPIAKLNRDPEHVRGTRKARLFLICLPIALIFLMILRPLYAPFIDVFGGDLLDQLLASEEGQGHVSAVSVSDDFLSEHWPVEASGTAAEKHTSSHVTDKRKKKNDEHRNRKLFSVERSYQ